MASYFSESEVVYCYQSLFNINIISNHDHAKFSPIKFTILFSYHQDKTSDEDAPSQTDYLIAPTTPEKVSLSGSSSNLSVQGLHLFSVVF